MTRVTSFLQKAKIVPDQKENSCLIAGQFPYCLYSGAFERSLLCMYIYTYTFRFWGMV